MPEYIIYPTFRRSIKRAGFCAEPPYYPAGNAWNKARWEYEIASWKTYKEKERILYITATILEAKTKVGTSGIAYKSTFDEAWDIAEINFLAADWKDGDYTPLVGFYGVGINFGGLYYAEIKAAKVKLRFDLLNLPEDLNRNDIEKAWFEVVGDPKDEYSNRIYIPETDEWAWWKKGKIKWGDPYLFFDNPEAEFEIKNFALDTPTVKPEAPPLNLVTSKGGATKASTIRIGYKIKKQNWAGFYCKVEQTEEGYSALIVANRVICIYDLKNLPEGINPKDVKMAWFEIEPNLLDHYAGGISAPSVLDYTYWKGETLKFGDLTEFFGDEKAEFWFGNTTWDPEKIQPDLPPTVPIIRKGGRASGYNITIHFITTEKEVKTAANESMVCLCAQKETGGVEPPNSGPRNRSWWKDNCPEKYRNWQDWFMEESKRLYLKDEIPPWCAIALRLWVADNGNYRIQGFSEDGTFINKWGEYGSGDGQFNWLYDITTDGDCIWATDEDLHRVQKFTKDGNFILKWGEYGSGDGQFDRPEGIAVSGDHIYVADCGNQRIQKFTKDGVFVDKFDLTSYGPEWGIYPCGIAVDANYIYISDGVNWLIKLSLGGAFIKEKYISVWGGYGYLMGISAYGNHLWMTDWVQAFKTTKDLEFVSKIGSPEDPKNFGFGIQTDGEFVWANMGYNNEVIRFDLNWTEIDRFGSIGSGDGQFDYIMGICST